MQMAKRVSLSRPWGLNREPPRIESLALYSLKNRGNWTHRSDRERMKKLDLALATTSLELDDAPTWPPVVETAMRPYLDLKGLAKGVEIVAQRKAKLLARSIEKRCGNGDATRWQSWWKVLMARGAVNSLLEIFTITLSKPVRQICGKPSVALAY